MKIDTQSAARMGFAVTNARRGSQRQPRRRRRRLFGDRIESMDWPRTHARLEPAARAADARDSAEQANRNSSRREFPCRLVSAGLVRDFSFVCSSVARFTSHTICYFVFTEIAADGGHRSTIFPSAAGRRRLTTSSSRTDRLRSIRIESSDGNKRETPPPDSHVGRRQATAISESNIERRRKQFPTNDVNAAYRC